MDITVSLCTYNNCELLNRALRSLVECDKPADARWELVVVNNRCTDSTDSVVESFLDSLPLVYVHEETPGLSAARNASIGAASGKLMLFTDDDVRVSPGWIRAYWDAYRETKGAHYYGGPIECEYPGYTPDAEILELAPLSVRGIDYGPDSGEVPPNTEFIGPNWACSRSAIDQAGSFDEARGLNSDHKRSRTGEESDLMRRLRARGVHPYYVPGAHLYHNVPENKSTVAHLADRTFAYGYTLAQDRAAKFSGPRIGPVPKWLLRALLSQAGRYALQRLLCRRGLPERIELSRLHGALIGHWEMRSQRTSGNQTNCW